MRALFICKKNELYGFISYARRSSGLYNSTRFIVEAVRPLGIDAKIVEVEDNNSIDREVTLFRPDVVIIEALWVVPEKFDILKKLHPKVKWFVHLHSNIPFLALEGIAIEWLYGCAKRGVNFIANSPESYMALKPIMRDRLIFLPNVYLSDPRPPIHKPEGGTINIGCFGAVRPLKNHLLQALASIKFARDLGMDLRFHINATRIETMGAPVLKNIQYLFESQGGSARLVQVPWLDPTDFMEYIRESIDLALQVSLTETFNVVTADCVTMGLPVVVSKEVKWVTKHCWAEDDSLDSIVSVMHRAYGVRSMIRLNQHNLVQFGKNSTRAWYEFLVGFEN